MTQTIFVSPPEPTNLKNGILDRKPSNLASILRDIFYDSGKTIAQIF